ncbi:MAG: NfeD family protein [Chlamydiota bacterium]|nr:NfeD family protein [Chlamydiota bacterium]
MIICVMKWWSIVFFLGIVALGRGESALERVFPEKEGGGRLFGHLAIDNPRGIDQSTYIYVKMALDHYWEKGVDGIILRLDTPGGEVFSSMRIADLLRESDMQHGAPVIASIDDWAISAGALLAYSCRFIAVAPTAIMGAAAPVIGDGKGGMETASEKVNSALRAEFASMAQFYGRNPLIAEAMVDADMALEEVGGEIVKGTGEGREITAEGKLLTLRADQLLDLGIADAELSAVLRGVVPVSSEESRWEGGRSLLFQAPPFDALLPAEVIRYHDWKVSLFSFLSHPIVAALLMLGLIIGGYIEFTTPGFGFPGAVAAFSLMLILLSSFALQALPWLEVIFLAVGLLLLAVEILILPGFGVAGVLGGLITLGALFALLLPGVSRLPSLPVWEGVADPLIDRASWLLGAFLLGLLSIGCLIRFASRRSRPLPHLVLHTESPGRALVDMPGVGTEGVTVVPLRPGGKVQIGKGVYAARSEGGFVAVGSRVVVAGRSGNELIVRPESEGAGL